MTRKMKSFLSVLAGAALTLGMIPSLSPAASAIDLINNIGLSSEFSEAVENGEWSVIDDHGFAADFYGDASASFDSDSYLVLECQGDTHIGGLTLGSMYVFSGYYYNRTSIYIPEGEEDAFLDVYAQYADALDFDSLTFVPEVSWDYDAEGHEIDLTQVLMLDESEESLAQTEEKLSLVTDMVSQLDDRGLVYRARFRALSARKLTQNYSRYLQLTLTADNAQDLADICAQYGTSIPGWDEKWDALEQGTESITAYTDTIDSLDTETALYEAIRAAYPDDVLWLVCTAESGGDASYSFNASTDEINVWDVVRGIGDTDTETDIILGDVNLDGKVDLSDVVTLSKIASGVMENTENTVAAGDVNSDGIISEDDSLVLLQFQMGLIRAIPITAGA